jgi:hypothetical protein
MAEADQAVPEVNGRDRAAVVLATLANLANESVSGVLLIEQNRDDAAEVSQLVPTAKALEALTGVVKTAASEYGDCEVIDYDAAAMTADGQVMWIDANEVPLLKEIVEHAADLAGVAMFDPANSTLVHLRLAAMRVDGDSNSAVFLQSLTGNQVVARSRTKIGLFVRRGTIDVPPDGQILLFSKDVAAIVTGEIAFFRNRAVFQRLFGYLEELKQQAIATFESITADLRIAGIEQMAMAVTGTTTMLGKMASIRNKVTTIPQYRDALTMPRLVAFINEHPECEVEVIGERDATQLVFAKDIQHRFKILKLLDDDYLRSELTELDYDANSKSAPIRPA